MPLIRDTDKPNMVAFWLAGSAFVFLIILYLVSCGPLPIYNPTMPGDPVWCEPMCKNLEKLECEFYDSECVEFCENALTANYATINPECVASAKTCEEAELCQ